MLKGNYKYMACDQYGHVYWIKEHPRKELMEKLNRKRAQKMYINANGGKTYHVGYIVGGHWCDVHEIKPAWRKPV